jgi:hypothetical protein
MTRRCAPSMSATAMSPDCSMLPAMLHPISSWHTWEGLAACLCPGSGAHARLAMNEREQGHLAALEQAVSGALGAAVAVL